LPNACAGIGAGKREDPLSAAIDTDDSGDGLGVVRVALE
jgi:hypothetical protein